jgi:aspartyl-tRNA(Asn)/glutamyl-tRNA(Gln) amidotransferase subunit B
VSARDAALERYELVVGMECHAQLNTRTKLFCGCKLEFAAPPNARTCPVCLGHPGTLPVLNREAFEKALRLAVAFEAALEPATEFDRKNYYYPDLPKNYQISQMYHNLGTGGRLTLLRSGRTVRMHNVHLEEDAGKLSHVEGGASLESRRVFEEGFQSLREPSLRGERTSSVDLNRAGTPLAEIVTMPDFRSIDEVDDYMDTLTELLRALDACHCQMQEGNLRFEASVSVRPRGVDAFGQRTEIKNLNSYSAVRKAIAWEQARQIALLEAGKTPRQETRLWDDEEATDYEQGVADAHKVPLRNVKALLPADWTRGWTQFMRSKEDAHDYRYFPEPDLPAIAVSPARVEEVRRALPELPGPRRLRYVGLGVAQKTAEDLTRNVPLATYFERVLALGVPAPEAASYVMNQVVALLNKRGLSAKDCPIPPEHVAELHGLKTSLPTDQLLKEVWPRVVEEGLSPIEVVKKHRIEALDPALVIAETDKAWAANPKAVDELVAGKDKAKGAIVGAVVRAFKTSAAKPDPAVINARLDALLAEEKKKRG